MQIEFGDNWNKTTRMFSVRNNETEITIERPFASKTMTLTKEDAKALANAILICLATISDS